MPLNLQTFDQIVAQSAAAVQSATNKVSNFSVGSLVRAILESGASVALWLQALAFNVLNATRLNTSSGSDVDSFLAQFPGISRLPAVAATGVATFSVYSEPYANAVLAVGTLIVTSDGTQQFSVVKDTTNAHWSGILNGYQLPRGGTLSISVPIIASNPGQAGNVAAGAISLIQSASDFDTVTNASATVSGQDAESDAAAKIRFAAFIQTRSLATPAAILYAALSVQSGISAFVAEYVDSEGNFKPGNFIVTVDDGSGTPPQSLQTEVYLAVDLVRGAGITFAVQAPSVVGATVSLTITVSQGYTKSVLQPLVQAALTKYISSLGVGALLPYSIISNVVYNTSPGIINVNNIFLNGGSADIGGGNTQVVRVASITVN